MHQIITQIAAPDAEESLAHYRKLGYQEHVLSDAMYLFFDKASSFILNTARDARHGLRCFVDDIEMARRDWQEITVLYDSDGGFFCTDPNGVYLFFQSRTDSAQILNKTDANEHCLCGVNYGLGIESGRFDTSLAFYTHLGYKSDKPANEKTAYITLTHDAGPPITLFKPNTCPHAFYNPSFTFFNGKEGNKKVIEDLTTAQVTIRQGISWFNPDGEVDNIIISDPGGFHSFIFNDG